MKQPFTLEVLTVSPDAFDDPAYYSIFDKPSKLSLDISKQKRHTIIVDGVACLNCGSDDLSMEACTPVHLSEADLWVVVDGRCDKCCDRVHGLVGKGESHRGRNCTWFYVGDLR